MCINLILWDNKAIAYKITRLQEWQKEVATTAAIPDKGVCVSHTPEAMCPVTTLGLVSAAIPLNSPACWGNAAEQAGPGPQRERHLKVGNHYRSHPVFGSECVLKHPRVEGLPGLNLIRALPLVVVPSGNISIWTIISISAWIFILFETTRSPKHIKKS